MRWRALVPLKPAALRKERLAGRLDPAQRERLSLRLLEQVTGALQDRPEIERIHLLSATRLEGWAHGWVHDEGGGLNAALQRARDVLDLTLGAAPLLVIHADLPMVKRADIEVLLKSAAHHGCAIAPDRHGEGTNAVALGAGQVFTFAFGPGSRHRHQAQIGAAALVRRPGLAFDCDTPDDLDLAIAGGWLSYA